jgi:pantoate--beta-alanine ligase
MQVCNTSTELHEQVLEAKNSGKLLDGSKQIIGFVPTMGALHQGHISLLGRCRAECDLSICSIFVNPTQFNEQSDFTNYPRNLESDLKLLEANGCDIAFIPDEKEVYPEPDQTKYHLNGLMNKLEGAHRPGHFNGVASVVKRLFELVQPHCAYFGLKDYQQFLVIKKLNEKYGLGVEVVGCEIIRDEQGLALSSRNSRLSAQGKQTALALSKSLKQAEKYAYQLDTKQLQALGQKELNETPGLELEYFDVVNADDLESTDKGDSTQRRIALTAAWVEGVRLIDNMFLDEA